MADAQFAVGEFFDDLQPCRMTESLKNFGLSLDGQLLRLCGMLHSLYLLDYIWYFRKMLSGVKRG